MTEPVSRFLKPDDKVGCESLLVASENVIMRLGVNMAFLRLGFLKSVLANENIKCIR